MRILIIVGILLLLMFGPQLWVRRVLARHHREAEDFPGNGGEFARHILNRMHLDHVKVESTDAGDHYDPMNSAVRLTADKLDGKTLTSIVTAAHEAGHAIQHAEGYSPFRWRTRLAIMAAAVAKIASFLLFLSPVVMLITRHPVPPAIVAVLALSGSLLAFVVQLVTLPVEWNASFGKALPILRSGYLDERQMKSARRILLACALTYLASSLAGLLNFWRWAQVLRR